MDGQLPLALSVGGVTFLLGVIWGAPFVEILRRLRIGKQVRAEIQDKHSAKIGTPTMGGIMIILPVVLISLALNIANVVQTGEGASIFSGFFLARFY
jgi:phospho-N-acetylmuramoyl-pentapeptide-transferase